MSSDVSQASPSLYASYRQVLDGFVSGLDVMLTDLCTEHASTEHETAEFQDSTLPDGRQAANSGSKRLYDDLIGATIGVDDPEEEEDPLPPAAPDKTHGEESYEAPSISHLYYNFDSLKHASSEELTTVERLQASSRMWFYPTLSRRDALHMLKHKEIGVFMVRNSSKVGNFALSMRQPPPHPYVQHYLIQKTEKGLQVQGAEHFFDSLEELIAHYTDYISGGMPTNLILPQSVADATTRHELRRVIEKEEAFLALLEVAATKPHTLDEEQSAMLQVGLETFPLDNTRVVAPKTAFRQSTDFLTLMQTHFDPTPVLQPTALPSLADRNHSPPRLPPKTKSSMRQRAFTAASLSTSQLPSGLLIDLSSSTEAPTSRPPPLPPKTRRISDTVLRVTEKHNGEAPRRSSDQLPPPVPLSDERPNLRQPPPIPKRDRWPAQPILTGSSNIAETTFSFESAWKDPPMQRSRSFSHRSTSSEEGVKALTPTSMPQDIEGYLMPKELMEIVENKPRKPPLQRSETPNEKHPYEDLDKVKPVAAPSNSEVVKNTQHKAPTKDEPADIEPAAPASTRSVGNRSKSGTSTRIKTTEWLKHRAANFSVVGRFSRTASQRLSIYLVKNAFSKNTSFGQWADTFVSTTQANTHDDPLKLAGDVRQFMTGLKNHSLDAGQKELVDVLSRSGDYGSLQEVNLRAVLETAMYKVILKPLKPTIYKSFIDKYTRDGSLHLLKQKMKAAKQMPLDQLGIRERLIPPQGPSLSQIGQHLVKMQKAFSPVRKLEHLLGAVRCVYSSVKDAQSELANEQLVLGADDFLPMVIYVLCQLEVWKIEVETEYMWAMLEPSLTAGEGGYYLTSITGAVQVIKQLPLPDQTDGAASATQTSGNSNDTNAARVTSARYWPELDGQTADGERLPCIADMQGFMRVHFDGELDGATSFFRTLPIPVDMNVSDTCAVIAAKFGVKNPEKYGLFKVEGDNATLLDDDAYPQLIKAEWLAGDNEYGQKHPTVTHLYFSYRRKSHM